jgi:Fe-S-cluster-containing hydrogenase component 2
MEVLLLRTIGKLEYFFPHLHRYFMRFLQGFFGGAVTPFENALEHDSQKRSWNTRQNWIRVNSHGSPESTGKYLKKEDVMILPTQEILLLAQRANLRPTVSYCFCRQYAQEQGHTCELHAPIRTCLTLSLPQSVDSMASTEPHDELVKNEKALYELFKKTDEIGLVHQVVFIPSPNYSYVICNCCPDCCEVLSGFRYAKKAKEYHHKRVEKLRDELSGLQLHSSQDGPKNPNALKKQRQTLEKTIKEHEKAANLPLSPLEVKSVFLTETISPETCTNCGKCASRCYFDSRYMAHGQMHYRPENCYGCGLCVTTCPQSIIRLVRRPKPVQMAKVGQGIPHIHPHQGSTHIHH